MARRNDNRYVWHIRKREKMLTPDQLLRISEGAEAIAEELHQEIIKQIIERIMIRIGRGESDLLTARDKWQLQTLQDAGYLLEDIQREIAKKAKLQQQEIKAAMENVGVRVWNYDTEFYRKAGIILPQADAPKLSESPYYVRLMQRNYEATLGEWNNFTRSFAERAQNGFLRAVDKAYHLTASGAVSYTEAVKQAVNEIASSGVVVTYPSGHRDTIETATLRCVRTGIAQATATITNARMDEFGWDIVLTSAHLGARTGDGGANHSNHLWWQGQFFSRSGKDKRFPPFSRCGLGEVDGICGANCRHSFGPGDGVNNPFATKDIMFADNYKAEQLNQRQRLLERRIRKTKREVMGLKAAVDSAEDAPVKAELDAAYQRKAALLQKQNQAYNQFCEENGLKRLSDRISIAQWDRKQAASATAAARRYASRKEA